MKRLNDGTYHIDADEGKRGIDSPIALPPECHSLYDRVQHESGFQINPKTVLPGGVIYFTRWHGEKPFIRVVDYGIVLEHYVDCIAVELLELADRRSVNGVPIREFVKTCPTPWKKLPRGWDYDTELFSVEQGRGLEELDYDTHKPRDILRAMEDGVIVPVKDNLHVKIKSKIDRHHGWRIVAELEKEYRPTYVTVEFHNAFERYEDAKAACDWIYQEYKRQASLSEYEWSVEQIDKVLDGCYVLTDDERKRYRDWLLARPNVENIEVRYFAGQIQWKYWKNKRWCAIVL